MAAKDPTFGDGTSVANLVKATKNREGSLSPLRYYDVDQQPWVFVPITLVSAAGNANAGLLLADLIRWLGTGGAETASAKPGVRVEMNGKIWLEKSQAALAYETGLTDTQVKRGLASLQKNKLIERVGRLELLRPTDDFTRRSPRGIKVYAGLVRMGGRAAPGFVLSQMHYWFSPGTDQKARVTQFRDGYYWLAKRYDYLAVETGLTMRQVRSAVNNLQRRGLIETSVHRFAGLTTLHLRFDEERFRRAWEEQETAWWASQEEQRRVGHGEL